jgi:hypothetical protein
MMFDDEVVEFGKLVVRLGLGLAKPSPHEENICDDYSLDYTGVQHLLEGE